MRQQGQGLQPFLCEHIVFRCVLGDEAIFEENLQVVEQLATPFSGICHEVAEPILPVEYAEQYGQTGFVRQRVDNLVVNGLRVYGIDCQALSSVYL